MTQPAAVARMSAVEFLAWERGQDQKHELYRGEVFAMSGGSPRHNYLGATAIVELHAALRGKPCHVLSSDQQIATVPGEEFVYADAVVVCGAFVPDPVRSDVLANPSIVLEVLSRSTESYDRGGKWQGYQWLPSVTDYLLVAQATVRIEHYRREADGWKYRVHDAGGTVELSNGSLLRVDAIYQGAFELPGD